MINQEKLEQVGRQLAEDVRAERKRRGWTQDDLADKTGVHRRTIRRVERREINPGINTFIKISLALDCSITINKKI